jgi:hypothetical protein
MPLPAGVLNELANAVREGRSAATHGTHIRVERAVSNARQIAAVLEACYGPVRMRPDAFNGSFSFTTPTEVFTPTAQTIALWHCDEGSGSEAADTTDNANDLTLANVTWDSGVFSTDGLRFNGSSSVGSVTLTSVEPVRRYLYFAAWINPTSGPLFQWEDVLEVYIDGSGNLVAQVEDQTYTGPAIAAGSWQLAHVQVFDGQVFVGVGETIWSFSHPNPVLTIPAWAVTVGKRDSTYYSGLMDEVRLVADVVVHDDWGMRWYRAQEESVLYCTFDIGSGSAEYHQDFIGPTVALVGTSWATGWKGNAVVFDGANGYATFTPHAAYTAAELSIEMTLKWAALGTHTLLDQEDGLNLYYTGSAFRSTLNGVTNPNSNLAVWTPDLDTWYNLALVYTGAEKQLWVNGQKRGTVAATGSANVPVDTVYLGRAWNSVPSFEGTLDFLHVARVVVKPSNRPVGRFILGQHGFTNGEDWILLPDSGG